MLWQLVVAGTIVALLATGWLLFAADADGAGGATEEVLPLEMRKLGELNVPLDQDHVVIRQADGQQDAVPVALSKSTYEATVRSTINGQAKDWSGVLSFYELRSTHPTVPFIWTLCTSWPVKKVFLLNDGSGEASYFALTISSKGFFIEIEKPRDRSTALADFFLKRDWNRGVHVPVVDLLDTLPFLTRSATKFPEISIVSIDRSQTGWVVKVCGPDSDRTFTLVSDGTSWHAE